MHSSTNNQSGEFSINDLENEIKKEMFVKDI